MYSMKMHMLVFIRPKEGVTYYIILTEILPTLSFPCSSLTLSGETVTSRSASTDKTQYLFSKMIGSNA